MAKCPNPYCDGQLVATIDFVEYGCSLSCDTCPFYILTAGKIEDKMSELLRDAEEKAAEWALENTDLEGYDWDKWEQECIAKIQKGKGLWWPSLKMTEYWKSRGVTLKEAEDG